MAKVFVCYSHKDERWKDRLVKQLGVLEEDGLLEVWEDRKIGAGAQDAPASSSQLTEAVQTLNIMVKSWQSRGVFLWNQSGFAGIVPGAVGFDGIVGGDVGTT